MSPASLPHRPSTSTPHQKALYASHPSISLTPPIYYHYCTTPRFACGSTNSISTSCDPTKKDASSSEYQRQSEKDEKRCSSSSSTAASYSYTRPRPFFGTLSLARFYCTSLACALPNLLDRVPRFLFPTDLLYYQFRSPASDNAVLALFVP